MRRSTIKRNIFIAAFWLLLWQMLSMIVGKAVILPSPGQAFFALMELLGTREFYMDAGITMLRCIAGIALSFVTGVLSAVLAYRVDFARSLLSAPVLVFKSTPVVGVILFFILLMSSGKVPVCVCFLMCYPVVYTNVLSGLDHLDGEQLEMTRIFGIRGTDLLRYFYIPSIMREITASLNLIAGLSWKTVVTAEVLAVPSYSMGYHLLNAKSFLETDKLFAWIIAIVCLSMLFEKGIGGLGRRSQVAGIRSQVLGRRSQVSGIRSQVAGGEVVFSDVSKRFGDKVVLDRFNVRFEGGKVTAVMGPSGQGKTTMLRLIAGLEKCDEGNLTGKDQRVSFLFQEDRLLPWLSLHDNIALPLKGKVSAETMEMDIERVLTLLELAENGQRTPSELSGGMKRRAAMARAFLFPAEVLLLDEPFKGLDQALKERIVPALLREYGTGKTVILVTHDQEDALAYADETVEMQMESNNHPA